MSHNELQEEIRSSLMAQGRSGAKEKDGKSRYEKRTRSKVTSIVKYFNKIDMQTLFTEDILTFKVPVQGETDNYVVTIKFGGLLKEIRNQINKTGGDVDAKMITQSLTICFNENDISFHCTCVDFSVNFSYWATKKGINAGAAENRPADERNPRDDKGPGCKHILCVLCNNAWIIPLSSTIMNYIKYMRDINQKMYADIIYPGIYGKEYEKPVQLSIDDKDELNSDEETINKSNEIGRTRGQFKKKENLLP